MNPPRSRAVELLPEVQRLIAEVLSLDPNQVPAAARILIELGAESIDLLDLRFRVEKAFGLRITSTDLAEVVGDGEAAARFAEAFTVQALAEYLARRLGEPDG